MTQVSTTTAQEPSPFLTEAQAAARIGVVPKTLRNWRSAGTGPTALRLGRSVRYHIDSLDGWALGQAA
ncbi:DNA-binding protein [Cryobacterium sp. TMT2-18-3]|uniref:helix-turn-helix transcriptional regulator n=1 Tax=unclassified Cryobacterium TaxID=2649013 RepID=UPI001069DD3B|nr:MULTISPECIES: helix-turn-helix domain-containing protein [unclassified Cryobacterium]TFC26401.1 DNA-binding protein [Cryobacterium sp. TMT2-18-2]TFC64419.1 DNA-binding protein [Cryobacterium sp. TMT2-18-3]